MQEIAITTLRNDSVIFFLRRIGPYHHARFQAFSQKVNLVAVETRPASEEYPWRFTAQGNHYKSVCFKFARQVEAGLRGKMLRGEIRAILAEHKASVIVTTGWADPEYHAVIIEAKKSKIPLVVISDSRVEDEPRKSWKELIKKIVLRSYSAALVAGSASRRYLEQLGFPSSGIFKPWDVVDNRYFSAISQNYDYQQRMFMCIARFIKKKNLLALLKAFGTYRKNGGKRCLVILGSGEQEPEIRQEIKKSFLESDVLLPGFIQYHELPSYFRKAHCLILPSTSDQWGLVVNEAMAAGVPVIVSKQCGCAEDLVKNGGNGFIFDAHVIRELLAMMEKMDALTENEWRRMSDSGRRTISDWDVSDFAEGLHRACLYAVKYPSRSGFTSIHKLLSR